MATQPNAWAAPDIEEVTVSSKEMDEAFSGKKTYQFFIISADEFIDREGRHISPKAIKAYLKKTKPDKKAAYVFVVPDKQSVAIAKTIIGSFMEYGATVFAIRGLDKAPKADSTTTDNTSTKPKTVMLVGQPNPEAHTARDPAPAMAERPMHLRPEPLPARVRYRFRPDAEVVAAADLTTRLLLDSAAPDNAGGFDGSMLVQPGAWKHCRRVSALSGTKPVIAKVELKGGVKELEGRYLNQAAQFTAAIAKIRALIAADGGGTIRAMRTAEMNDWWTFITLDIEEPTFVLETKGGKYLFIVCWLKGHVFCIDELRALPKQ